MNSSHDNSSFFLSDSPSSSLPGYATSPLIDSKSLTIHKGHLPHWTSDTAIQFITFRLGDSLPQTIVQDYKERKERWLDKHPRPWDDATEKEYHSLFSFEMDEYLDRGLGRCILREPGVTEAFEDALRYYNNTKYHICAYVIMPNHIHLLLQQIEGVDLSKVLHSIKSYTASKINSLTHSTGRLWMPESFDRMIRNEQHLIWAVEYIWKNYNNGGLSVWEDERLKVMHNIE